MSNQQAPTRPWFRLASISRPSPPQEPSPIPEPAPAPPRPAAIRTTFRPTVQDQPPPAAAAAAGGVSLIPTSPVLRASQAKPSSPVTTTTRMASPKALTTTVKPSIRNQIQSPKTKPPIARPPSPLTLPPSQLKEPSKEGETKEKDRNKKYSTDFEDAGMRVITITGNNKGAFMKIMQSPHKNGFQGSPHRLQKNANSNNEAGDSSKMKAKSNSSKTIWPMNAFINSNVQGINNSIVYNSSCSDHDPGVHLNLYS